MVIPVKWLRISAIAFVLAQVGRMVFPARPTTNPAPPFEIANLFPGPVGNEDLSAWVLEPKNESTPSAPAPFSSSRTESWRSVANRNSNPLNIKLGSETRRYVEIGRARISDIIPKDGGRFLKFDSPATGFRAAVELLSTRPYDDLKLERALRRWSSNGYGARILAGTQLDAQKPLPYLGRDDLRILLSAMAAAEGYKSSTIADEIKKALRP